jgi:hypothetical protein
MKFPVRSLWPALVLALGAGTAGCSAGAGGGGLLDYPGGTISLTDANTGAAIVTSPDSPYIVPTLQLKFTLFATETHYDGPYNVQVVYETNMATSANGGNIYPFSFNEPCFTPTEVDTFTQASIPITFSGNAANGQLYAYPNGAPTGSTASAGNPCHSGEYEEATISDTKGHTVKFYYEEQ